MIVPCDLLEPDLEEGVLLIVPSDLLEPDLEEGVLLIVPSDLLEPDLEEGVLPTVPLDLVPLRPEDTPALLFTNLPLASLVIRPLFDRGAYPLE